MESELLLNRAGAAYFCTLSTEEGTGIVSQNTEGLASILDEPNWELAELVCITRVNAAR